MSLAALLRRATASEFADDWAAGTHVRCAFANGREPLEGRVIFTHEGIVYWVGTDRSVHASTPDYLQRRRP